MEKPKSKIPHIVISLLVIVLAVISYWFYSYSVAQKEFENLLEIQFQESEKKLEEENNLRSQLDDIIEQYDNSRNEIDNLNIELDDKQSEIDELKSEIRDLLKEIENKEDVENALKEAKKKIDALQNISKKYFEQVDSLLGETEQLVLENKNLEKEITSIKDKNKNLNSENTDLNARLNAGSILEISKIEIDKFKEGLRGELKGVYFTKNIKFLSCCFKIAANSIAKAEIKTVYIQYISPSGELLQSSKTPEESIFSYEDSTMNATTYSEFNYQNREIELCVDWERGDPLIGGKYEVLFFIEGKLVSASTFNLR